MVWADRLRWMAVGAGTAVILAAVVFLLVFPPCFRTCSNEERFLEWAAEIEPVMDAGLYAAALKMDLDGDVLEGRISREEANQQLLQRVPELARMRDSLKRIKPPCCAAKDVQIWMEQWLISTEACSSGSHSACNAMDADRWRLTFVLSDLGESLEP